MRVIVMRFAEHSGLWYSTTVTKLISIAEDYVFLAFLLNFKFKSYYKLRDVNKYHDLCEYASFIAKDFCKPTYSYLFVSMYWKARDYNFTRRQKL